MGLHKLFGSVLGGKSSPAQRVGEVPGASRGMGATPPTTASPRAPPPPLQAGGRSYSTAAHHPHPLLPRPTGELSRASAAEGAFPPGIAMATSKHRHRPLGLGAYAKPPLGGGGKRMSPHHHSHPSGRAGKRHRKPPDRRPDLV